MKKDYFGILETNLNELARMFKMLKMAEEEKKTMNFEELKDKIYLVIGHDIEYSGGWGDYVSLYGVYSNEEEATERMVELLKETMETGDIGETFEVKSVEFNQNIDEFLGGHVE